MHGGETLVRRAASAALAAGLAPVIVVVGANADEIVPSLGALTVEIVVNHQWKSGLASSLTAGLRFLDHQTSYDGVLVMLADQPLVDAPALQGLVNRFGQGRRIVASEYAGTLGVPAIFGREHMPSLMKLTGDTGAGRWLRENRGEVTAVPLDAAALDIDTPADAERLPTPASRAERCGGGSTPGRVP